MADPSERETFRGTAAIAVRRCILEASVRHQEDWHAGAYDVEAAWLHLRRIIETEARELALLLAAIEAVSTVRPELAREVLVDLLHCGVVAVEEIVQETLLRADSALRRVELDRYDDR